MAESLTWDKMSDKGHSHLAPRGNRRPGKRPRNLCRETAAEKQKELDALVKREAEILEEMLHP